MTGSPTPRRDKFREITDQPGRRAERNATLALRCSWLLLPVTLGPLTGDLLHHADTSTHTVTSVVLWFVWALLLTASLIPLPSTLTVLRIAGPGVVALAVWCGVDADDGVWTAVGLVNALLAALTAFTAPVADRFVDGASYGDERRFLLRAPGPVALVLGPLATAVTVAGAVLGPALIADGRRMAGTGATVIGWSLATLAARALYRLGRRWVVLVPAGFVLHDHLALAEPTLLQRAGLERIAAAPVDTDALDLTQRARGLALEVRCRKPHDLLTVGARGTAESRGIEALLCSPARPDVVLAEAARRRLPTD